MGIGVTELLLILAIVLLIFGTKKLRSIGGDLGGAIKNFRTAMKEGENEKPESEKIEQKGKVIEGEAVRDKDKV